VLQIPFSGEKKQEERRTVKGASMAEATGMELDDAAPATAAAPAAEAAAAEGKAELKEETVANGEAPAAPSSSSSSSSSAAPASQSESADAAKAAAVKEAGAAAATAGEQPIGATVETKAETAAPAPAQKISAASLPIRPYLDQTVVPVLLSALSQLVKERPDGDPVEWLAHWLLRNNPNKKS